MDARPSPEGGENTPEALKWQQLLLQFPEREGRGGETGGQMKGFFDVPRLG